MHLFFQGIAIWTPLIIKNTWTNKKKTQTPAFPPCSVAEL